MEPFRLSEQAIDPAAELARFATAAAEAGAVVSFTGVARARGAAGAALDYLELDWYPGMTERSICDIGVDALGRFGIVAATIVHRCGIVPVRAPIVFVAAAAAHRREAFQAADYMMDRLKTEAVFWKREVGPDGARWIEPTDRDHDDRSRWSE
ncbi:molybdopterin synthase catalytic subunit [Pseudochelatococcus lubricantis]|uniref:Molybdopterin synthase catalytic subunit n=1 Tax=Pseudochelatococcus lubricantis TaxID=1538102 RepID=A0ABX0V3K0_9HYPH|nr:molybdenum cofactor biosynthesis protein MoaE [Pseudochelatococcus lubricantis]NIJ59794.1 molybdopterin synthase catalytic subunit [Pseudochelatococcus lubricantis]